LLTTKKCQSPSNDLDFFDGDRNPFLVTNNKVTKTIFQSPTITSFCRWQLNFQSPWSARVMLNESFPKTYYMPPPFPKSIVGDQKNLVAIQLMNQKTWQNFHNIISNEPTPYGNLAST